MTRLLIELPEELEIKLKAKVIQGGYADTQDYLRALISADTEELPQLSHV